ncbi:MAG: hypothetical protein P8Z35_03430 [Ignavibacteriaceae bacterium]|jgi:hypothetical protein
MLVAHKLFARQNGKTLKMRDSIISATKEIINSVKYCALITIRKANGYVGKLCL